MPEVFSGSAMQSSIAPVLRMISAATTRPAPSARGSRRCDTTARSDSDSRWRTHGLFKQVASNTAINRAMVRGASVVCTVLKTKCPVSRRLERDVDGGPVAHLADHDDVGILAERRAEGCLEALGVAAEFALDDIGLLVAMQVFDRIFDRG